MRKELLLFCLASLAGAASVSGCHSRHELAQDLKLDVSSIANAASRIAPNYPNGGIARGGLFVVNGAAGGGALGACNSSMADAIPIAAHMTGTGMTLTTSAKSFPVATGISGSSMKIAMAGASYDVPMISVAACSGSNRLAGIVPSNVPVGTGTLTVTYNGHAGSAPIKVVDRMPGLFTINGSGTGAAVIQNFNSARDLPLNTLATPAKPGQTAIAWGTGLGPDGHSDTEAPKPTDIPVALEMYVGGKPAKVTYKGRSDCCAGVDRIVFQVPDGVDGCFVPLVAKVGSAVSNFATMSISASGGPCSDPAGITAAEIQAAQHQARIRLGFVSLVRADIELVSAPNVGAVTRRDQAVAAFADFSFADLQGLPVREVSVPGSCTVLRGMTNDLLLDRPPVLAPLVNLDAGTLTIEGRAGSAALPYRGGFYSRVLGATGYREPAGGPTQSSGSAFLEPGSVTVSTAGGGALPGGKQIGAFTATVAVAAPPAFENRFSVGDVQRSEGVTVRWSGADPAATIAIRGISVSNGPAAPGAAFFCIEKASAGQFTVPPAVLLSLPASSNDVRMPSESTLGLSVAATRVTRFTAPGLDAGFLRSSALIGRNVHFH